MVRSKKGAQRKIHAEPVPSQSQALISPHSTQPYKFSPPRRALRVGAIDELATKGEDDIELLKAVKDLFAPDVGGQKRTLRAAAAACLPRALELS